MLGRYLLRHGSLKLPRIECLTQLRTQVFSQLPILAGKMYLGKIIYEVIPNRRYADGVIVLIRGIYESCRELGADFRSVGLGDWLMFQQAESEYPIRNITLKNDHSFQITTIDYSGESDRVVVEPTTPKNYEPLLDKIIE